MQGDYIALQDIIQVFLFFLSLHATFHHYLDSSTALIK